jgi:hypothetical protein
MTDDSGLNPDPATVTVNGPAPARVDPGNNPVRVGAGFETTAVALPDLLESCVLVAAIATVFAEGGTFGA